MMSKEEYFHNSKYNLFLAKSNIPNAGNGVYTHDYIPPNTLIDEYTGAIYTYNHGGGYTFNVTDDYYIDARDYPRCYMGMVNDCSYIQRVKVRRKKRWVDKTPESYYDAKNQRCVINCTFVTDTETKRVYIHSTTGIEPGSELFVSYGDDYWK